MNNNILLCRAASIIFCTFMYIISISKLHNNYIINALWYFFYNCIGQQLTTKHKFVVLKFMQVLKLNIFFPLILQHFFGLVLKAEWIFLFRMQVIWTFFEIIWHWNKSKRQRIPNLKKKKSTKILTRQTLEYFTQRNDTFRSFWLKMKIYVCSLISNFINFYFDICFDWRKKKEHLVSNILTFDFVSQNRNSHALWIIIYIYQLL